MKNGRRSGLWPRALFVGLALVPVLALVTMVWTLARESAPAVRDLGLSHLFSTQYSGRFTLGLGLYGLLPSMWGTTLSTLLATALALPVSMAMALLASEFPLGRASRVVSGFIGALSGIPPIVYALMGIVVVRTVIGPKFCAEDLPAAVASELPGLPPWNAGLLPNSMPNSTVLAGLLIGMLMIPFMTPLIQDALHSVPEGLREAAWALGATRWHTWSRVVLPIALPGIAGALGLGMLKGAGEVVIASYVVGYEGNLPAPLWDVFERVPTLTATGAGLLGGLGMMSEGSTPVDHSVGFFSGLVLLVIAAVMLSATAWLERKLRRRLVS